jgi:hypothetical protein
LILAFLFPHHYSVAALFADSSSLTYFFHVAVLQGLLLDSLSIHYLGYGERQEKLRQENLEKYQVHTQANTKPRPRTDWLTSKERCKSHSYIQFITDKITERKSS